MMIGLKLVLWITVVGSFFANWSDKNYRSNTYIYIVSLLALTAIYLTEMVVE